MGTMNDSKDRDDAFASLAALLGERFSTADAIRVAHGKDASWHPPHPPDAVCFTESTQEVVRIVEICARHRLPVVPFGAGTSLEGQVHALHGGISLDLSRMERILAIRADDLDATVEAGVTRQQLNRRAEDHGLFFPVDPGAEATLGGMAATRASGTNAVRYGTMSENVLALTVVLGDGRVVKTSQRARKSAAGYDLTHLFVGSEGTLGVITELTVRLYGIPEALSSAVVSFPDLEAAVRTAIETIQTGIPVARIELLDALMMDAVNRYASLDYAPRPTLMLEFHGSAAGVEEQARDVEEIAGENGGSDFRWATEAAQRERLWEARHHVYFAALALRPGCEGWSTDVCVPISRLADCILETQQDVAGTDLVAPLVGHVGDGNFHLLMIVDPEDEADVAEAERIHTRLVERALGMDGTSTGEHGVGIGKSVFMEAEHGRNAIDVMRSLKAAIDPENLMNPGKIFPA